MIQKMAGKSKAPKVYIVTGEASGDLLGGRLMKALKNKDSTVRVSGIGGDSMIKEGLQPLFPGSDLSVMGFFELLPHLYRLIKRFNQVKKDILEKKPDIVVTIDFPGFNFRLAKALKKEVACPLVHYTAPSVWAWKPGRAKKIAKIYDHLLTLFAFEPPYFDRENLPCTFVGHPLIEGGISSFSTTKFREVHNLSEETPLLCFLPGSRDGEVEKLLPFFVETVLLLKDRISDLTVVCPTLPRFQHQISEAFQGKIPLIFTQNPEEKYYAMAASQAAIAASGTVSLELALTNTPMVIGYQMNALTHLLAKKLVKTPYVCLVNILHQEFVVPEFIQENCTSENLSKALMPLLLDSKKASQQQCLSQVPPLLKNDLGTPSDLAAEKILNLLNGKNKD